MFNDDGLGQAMALHYAKDSGDKANLRLDKLEAEVSVLRDSLVKVIEEVRHLREERMTHQPMISIPVPPEAFTAYSNSLRAIDRVCDPKGKAAEGMSAICIHGIPGYEIYVEPSPK